MIAARSRAVVLADVMSLLPRGRAWTRSLSSDIAKVLGALAGAVARLEDLVATLAVELSPATASAFLDDFERVLGSDPCGLDDTSGMISVRRLQAWRRWTRKGGQSIPYFIALAAGYGFDITIETYRPVIAGDELGASPLISSPEQFVWTVNLGLVWEREPICGDQACGDYLGDLGVSPVECLIRRYAPAHTIPTFSYH